MFDTAGRDPYDKLSSTVVETPASRELALQAARESLELLKNDGVLPFKNHPMAIAVVGPTADLLATIEGNYNGEAAVPVTPLAGLRKQFGADKILYAPGSILAQGTPAPIPSRYPFPTFQGCPFADNRSATASHFHYNARIGI